MFTRKKAPLIGVQSWKDVKDVVKIAIVDEMLVSQLFSLAKCYEFSTSALLFYLSFHSNRKFGTSMILKMLVKRYVQLPKRGTKDGELHLVRHTRHTPLTLNE